MENRTIQVWRWEDAPEDFRQMSKYGGDEEWVALVPPALAGERIGWIGEGGTPFGQHVQRKALADGSELCIGAHA